MTHETLRDQARVYYEAKLRNHGATPAGMDWNSQASQELRFRQLARLWDDEPRASVLDYGCGYAGLASYLRGRGHTGPYLGFDVSAEMVAAAGRHVEALDGCRVTSRRADLTPFDYAVASGVLNVRQQAGDPEWASYVRETIADLASLGTRGFAFNALTLYSDADATLDALRQAAADERRNMMPYILEAVRASATLGEMCEALRDVFGAFQESSVL